MIQTKQKSVSRASLRKVALVRPVWSGDRWQGVQHGELADLITKSLDSKGIEILREDWYLSRQDAALSGSLQIRLPNLDAPEGMDFALGVQHSNDCEHALKFAVGAKIFICSNGLVHGDFAIKRKHTQNLNLADTIGEGLERYLSEAEGLAGVISQMRTRGLSDSTTDRILMQAGREGVLPWSRIGQVDKEYRKPTFAEMKGTTAWNLYNAFTYVAQKSPAHQQIKAISRFRDIVLN